MIKCHVAVRVLLVSCGVAWMVASGAAPALSQSLSVDPVHSTVLFRIKHMNTSHTWGRFNDLSGKLNLASKDPSLEMQLKVDSVDTANEKRDQHLKGPDFFNAKQFPTIAFKSTKITKTGDALYEVEGVLNFHGVERPLKVKLERTGTGTGPMGGSITGFDTTFAIKRSDYGMKYMVGPIGDDVLVSVSLECAAN